MWFVRQWKSMCNFEHRSKIKEKQRVRTQIGIGHACISVPTI